MLEQDRRDILRKVGVVGLCRGMEGLERDQGGQKQYGRRSGRHCYAYILNAVRYYS